MTKVLISLGLIIVSFLGILDATYLTYEKLSGGIVPCGAGWDCGKVLGSQFASIGPIPLSAIGILFYVIVFLLSLVHYLEVDEKLAEKYFPKFIHRVVVMVQGQDQSSGRKKFSYWHSTLILWTSLGLGFSIIFVGLMAFVIQAWCKFCVLSAASSTTLFLLTMILIWEEYRTHKNDS